MNQDTFVITFYTIYITGLICTICSLYFFIKEFLIYIRVRKNFYNAMNNKTIIHRTIVALMSNLLQTDNKEILQEKLIFISNYIHLTIKDPKEKKLAFKIVEETIKKEGENEENSSYDSIHIFLDLLKSKTLDDKSFPIRQKKSPNHVITPNRVLFKSHFNYENTVKELATYLNESQKKYVAYLLFHIAYLDNTINDSEWDMLKGICKDLLPSTDDLNKLYFAFQNGTYIDWYFNNIHAENPNENYDPENVVDFLSNYDDKTPFHTHSFQITVCICAIFSIILIISDTLLVGGIDIEQIIFYNLLLLGCIILSCLSYNRHKTIANTFQIIFSYQDLLKHNNFIKKQYLIYVIGSLLYFGFVKTDLKNEGDYLFKSEPATSFCEISKGEENTLAINRFHMEMIPYGESILGPWEKRYQDLQNRLQTYKTTERQKRILNALGERLESNSSSYNVNTYSRISTGKIALKGFVKAEICRGYFGENYYITHYYIESEDD